MSKFSTLLLILAYLAGAAASWDFLTHSTGTAGFVAAVAHVAGPSS